MGSACNKNSSLDLKQNNSQENTNKIIENINMPAPYSIIMIGEDYYAFDNNSKSLSNTLRKNKKASNEILAWFEKNNNFSSIHKRK